ncbi:hypothetical protein FRB98_000242 [Tulasnella sp. 332]|nr:hypothetical protein FRB98_000242 [Tulasnella sp. 332]
MPTFLVRLIKLTHLLDQRELDRHAALAYYKLSVIDWQNQDPTSMFNELDATVLSRLASGRSKTLHRNLKVVQEIVQHQCVAHVCGGPPQNPSDDVLKTKADDYQKTKRGLLELLVPKVCGDFAEELSSAQYSFKGKVCDPIQSLVRSEATVLFDSMIIDFGFPTT